MVKHTQTIYRLLQTSCLSVFDHFVGLAIKGLSMSKNVFRHYPVPSELKKCIAGIIHSSQEKERNS